ncbi:hypothetical protein TNCV_1372031 [Trichonephila clavipes]|nr:hypothetical protein TNCV_1372031 [Trichonephila clavipes]
MDQQVEVQPPGSYGTFFSMNSAILSDTDNVTAFGVADVLRVEVRVHGEKYATRTLNILQLNINGTQRKIEELTEILNVNKVHIACLQETKLNPNLKLKSKALLLCEKTEKTGLVAALLSLLNQQT